VDGVICVHPSAWTKSFASIHVVEKRRSGVVDWTKSFASILPSVREAVKWRSGKVEKQKSGEAEKWRSGVVDWTKSFASIRPSTKWRSGKVETRRSGLDKVPAGAKAGAKAFDYVDADRFSAWTKSWQMVSWQSGRLHRRRCKSGALTMSFIHPPGHRKADARSIHVVEKRRTSSSAKRVLSTTSTQTGGEVKVHRFDFVECRDFVLRAAVRMTLSSAKTLSSPLLCVVDG
jgi:hypothetical protein